MVWHDKKWKDKRPLSAIKKTSGTELPAKDESMPVVIDTYKTRSIASRRPGAPYHVRGYPRRLQ